MVSIYRGFITVSSNHKFFSFLKNNKYFSPHLFILLFSMSKLLFSLKKNKKENYFKA